MSDEKIMPPYRTSKILSPKLEWYNSRVKLKFKGTCLKQEYKAPFTPKNVLNFFIVYELGTWPRDLDSTFSLRGCLFGGVKLAKNADSDKYVYSGYGIGFDTRIEYSLPNGSVGKNITIFGVDISSCVDIDNKEKDILILGKGPTQGLNDTTLAAETQYSINFTRPGIKFCLNLHYNGSNSFLFVNATKNTSFQCKSIWNIETPLVFRKYFKGFFS